jgi:hypothetical protein
MWFKERDDVLYRSKFLNNKLDNYFLEYSNIDKLVLKLSEYDSPCLCSFITKKYICIITLNTNNEHKATYKLQLYCLLGSNKYTDMGIFYSYFA